MNLNSLVYETIITLDWILVNLCRLHEGLKGPKVKINSKSKMQYNYQKYIKLLKYDDSFRKKTKFLEDENKLKYLELKNYSRQINEHLHWYQKNEYLQLIEDFLSFKINGKKFESKFCSMVEAIEKECLLLTKNYERLKTIELNPISFGFAKWISEIYFCCDELYSDFDKKDPPDFPFAKTEEQLRDAVKSLFPEIQKYF